MTDRICIASNGTTKFEVAAEDIVSCCKLCGQGCNGGYPSMVWNYWKTTGIVSGGAYQSNQGCYPYQIANCSHHVVGTIPACATDEVPTPACANKCQDGETWASAKNKGASSYSVSSVANIQAEILAHGPVEGSFTVYDDFLNYKSGVYVKTSSNALGGHAIKILGWGTDATSKLDYWLVANSWNNQWGDNGFFKIQRGVDMCGIEDGVVAGLPSN